MRRGCDSSFTFCSVYKNTSSFLLGLVARSRHTLPRKHQSKRCGSLHGSSEDVEQCTPFRWNEEVQDRGNQSGDGSGAHKEVKTSTCIFVREVVALPDWKCHGEQAEEDHAAALDQEPKICICRCSRLVGGVLPPECRGRDGDTDGDEKGGPHQDIDCACSLIRLARCV